MPAEHYDMVGLVGEYTAQVVSKLKVLRTLGTLVSRPGRLTIDFMEGRRIDQVNPVWLFTFVWSTVVTVSHFFLQPESGAMFGDAPPELLDAAATMQPWFLGVLAYTSPVVSLLASVAFSRVLFTSRWIEAWVFSLHVGLVNLILNAPLSALMAWFGLWGEGTWLVLGFTPLAMLPPLIYVALAFRTVFAGRVAMPWVRFAAYFLACFAAELAWSGVLGVALFFAFVAAMA
ncbi:MAG: DUF3667 domain-containing protein [Myxococcota bacterium]